MNILITGSTGFIGSNLNAYLTRGGHRVSRLVRSAPRTADEIYWDPPAAKVDSAGLEGFDAVVHLAGESITPGRWTAEKKRRIRESRIQSTRLLSQALEGCSKPPEVFISASAIGYYGDRGEEEIDEESAAGNGFLADVCREWEKATESVVRKGIRVVILRMGMVLSASGGALALMLPIFRLGIGGKLGSGRQYMSWVVIDDVVRIIEHSIRSASLAGPVNAASPDPVTNLAFAKTLGRVLSRPALFALPSFAARLIFGEMADELLLASARVVPSRLKASGYQFRFPTLEGALRHIIEGSRA